MANAEFRMRAATRRTGKARGEAKRNPGMPPPQGPALTGRTEAPFVAFSSCAPSVRPGGARVVCGWCPQGCTLGYHRWPRWGRRSRSWRAGRSGAVSTRTRRPAGWAGSDSDGPSRQPADTRSIHGRTHGSGDQRRRSRGLVPGLRRDRRRRRGGQKMCFRQPGPDLLPRRGPEIQTPPPRPPASRSAATNPAAPSGPGFNSAPPRAIC